MRSALATVLLAPMLLAACATPANHYDPLEPVNRKIYAFNDALDKGVVKPVAKGYIAVTPKPVRTGVSNFFSNLEDLYVGTSNLLQGNVHDALGDGARFVLNSTFGILGFVDIASQAGLAKHDEDFGQVLGHWGVGSGPFIVMPLLGPKTVRDSVDWVGSRAMDPMRAVNDQGTKNTATALAVVDLRATLLPADDLVQAASFGDDYAFVRDSYLQRRYNLVWDNHPPKPLPMGNADDDEIDVKNLDMSSSPKPSDKPVPFQQSITPK